MLTDSWLTYATKPKFLPGTRMLSISPNSAKGVGGMVGKEAHRFVVDIRHKAEVLARNADVVDLPELCTPALHTQNFRDQNTKPTNAPQTNRLRRKHRSTGKKTGTTPTLQTPKRLHPTAPHSKLVDLKRDQSTLKIFQTERIKTAGTKTRKTRSGGGVVCATSETFVGTNTAAMHSPRGRSCG